MYPYFRKKNYHFLFYLQLVYVPVQQCLLYLLINILKSLLILLVYFLIGSVYHFNIWRIKLNQFFRRISFNNWQKFNIPFVNYFIDLIYMSTRVRVCVFLSLSFFPIISVCVYVCSLFFFVGWRCALVHRKNKRKRKQHKYIFVLQQPVAYKFGLFILFYLR